MITVIQYDNICQQIVHQISELNGYLITSTDEQTKNKIKDKTGIQLVAVYPSYTFNGAIDSYQEAHEILFFVVIKPKEGAGNLVEMGEYQRTQDVMIKVKEYLFGENSQNFCKLFPNLDVSSVSIDPEYNIFGGFNGWSIKLVC